MIRRPPRSTRTDTLFPYTTLFRSPPYTTLHVGVVHGGTALNIISRECTFTWDIRALPGDDWRRYLERFQEYAQSLLPAMQAIAPAASISTAILPDAPPLQAQGGAPPSLALSLCGPTPGDVVSPEARHVGKECFNTCNSG